MGRAHSGNPPRRDFAALGYEVAQHLHIFIVDVVDLLDAKPAHFLTSEILFLSGCNGLISARGALRSRYGTAASCFWHTDSPCSSFQRLLVLCLGMCSGRAGNGSR